MKDNNIDLVDMSPENTKMSASQIAKHIISRDSLSHKSSSILEKPPTTCGLL